MLVFLALAVFIACDNSGIAFVNDIKELPKGSSSWDSSVIIPIVVAADPQEKFIGDIDPVLTYTFSPDPLPSGVSIVGALVRSKAGTPEGEVDYG